MNIRNKLLERAAGLGHAKQRDVTAPLAACGQKPTGEMHQPHAPLLALIQARGVFERGKGFICQKDRRTGPAFGAGRTRGEVINLRIQQQKLLARGILNLQPLPAGYPGELIMRQCPYSLRWAEQMEDDLLRAWLLNLLNLEICNL